MVLFHGFLAAMETILAVVESQAYQFIIGGKSWQEECLIDAD